MASVHPYKTAEFFDMSIKYLHTELPMNLREASSKQYWIINI